MERAGLNCVYFESMHLLLTEPNCVIIIIMMMMMKPAISIACLHNWHSKWKIPCKKCLLCKDSFACTKREELNNWFYVVKILVELFCVLVFKWLLVTLNCFEIPGCVNSIKG